MNEYNSDGTLRVNMEVVNEIKSRFSFHTPDSQGVEEMDYIRTQCRNLANEIDRLCPESKEKSIAITQLQIVMMMANSSIVQKYPVKESDK